MTVTDDWLHDQLWKLASFGGPDVDLSRLDEGSIHRLLAIARVHGVLGIILARLRPASLAHSEAWNLARRAWKGEVVQSMRVRRHAKDIQRTLSHVGIPAVILKGPDFADHLYPDPHLRPTLDVDVLVPRHRWADAGAMLEATGHTEKPGQPGPFLATGLLSERTWLFPLPGGDIEVDLHWSLVHLPEFRKQASVDYWNLDWRWLPDGTGELTSASRFVIAAVHALYHHQFDRLLLLIDLQLAGRSIPSAPDQQAVRVMMERTNAHLAVNVALQVTARFLGDPAIEHLRQVLFWGLSNPRDIPEGVWEDARRNLRSVRNDFLAPGRQRIRDWLLRQPMRPKPGWEMHPAAG
jgi:hypothetical protein